MSSHVEGADDGVGYGVSGSSNSGHGVYGESDSSYGVSGKSDKNIGVYGYSINSHGVYGESDYGVGVCSKSNSSAGVWGESNSGHGVYGHSQSGFGVVGSSNSSAGVAGSSNSGTGVWGESNSGYGMYGESNNSAGMYGGSQKSFGVEGYSIGHIGIYGHSDPSSLDTPEFIDQASPVYMGVAGNSGSNDSGYGVYGVNTGKGVGIFGRSGDGIGIQGYSRSGIAICGLTHEGSGLAAHLVGNVKISGNLQKAGGLSKIDHPLDPENKYLCHSAVESQDMKNVYDGVVVLDDKGEAIITLPDWFGALNKDFRYQLTAIGAPGPNLYIAEKISDTNTKSDNGNSKGNGNHFKIAGGTSGMEVSWQVTGIRKDPWASVHRVVVEEDKPDRERGYYMHPELYHQTVEKGISHLLFPK